MWVLDIFASAGFGSLLGGIFGFLNKREERANMKMKLDHEVLLITARTDAQIKLADKQIESSKVNGELAVEKEEVKAFTASQKTSTIGEAVKSAVRPLITFCLLYVSYQLTMSLNDLVGGLESIPAEELAALYKIVILQIFGLTGVCVGWWFATRNSKSYDKLIGRYM